LIAALKIYLDIILLRRGPEDVPVSASLLVMTLGLFVALNVLLRLAFPPSASVWPIALAVSVAFALVWFRGLLIVFGKPERFQQVVCAIFGVGCWLAPIVVPLGSALESVAIAPADAAGGSAPTPIPTWIVLLLPLVIYAIYLNARILRAALDRPLALCISLILLQTLIEVLLVSLVVGPAVGTPAAPASAPA
jgi:hypothetical protein